MKLKKEVPGWNTTDSSIKLEFWADGAHIGQNYVELNAHHNTSIYQDVLVNGGETITFSFRHKASAVDGETVKVIIGIPEPNAENNNSKLPILNGKTIYNEEFSVDKADGWLHHSGEVVLPKADEPYEVRISISSASGREGMGNFLDDINFSSDAIYDPNLEATEISDMKTAISDKKLNVSSDFIHVAGDTATDIKTTFNVPTIYNIDEQSIQVINYSGNIEHVLQSSEYNIEIDGGKLVINYNNKPALENVKTSFNIRVNKEKLNVTNNSDITMKSNFRYRDCSNYTSPDWLNNL